MAKILIVDDSPMSRRLLRGILEMNKHEVVEADSGDAALATYAEHRPQVVMLDLNMEGTHGLNVLVELRKLDAQARIVVASADSQHSTRATVKAGGACAMIAKPLAADRVINTVNTVLGGGTTWS